MALVVSVAVPLVLEVVTPLIKERMAERRKFKGQASELRVLVLGSPQSGRTTVARGLVGPEGSETAATGHFRTLVGSNEAVAGVPIAVTVVDTMDPHAVPEWRKEIEKADACVLVVDPRRIGKGSSSQPGALRIAQQIEPWLNKHSRVLVFLSDSDPIHPHPPIDPTALDDATNRLIGALNGDVRLVRADLRHEAEQGCISVLKEIACWEQ